MLSGAYRVIDFPLNIQNPQHNNGNFKKEKMQHFVVKCCIFALHLLYRMPFPELNPWIKNFLNNFLFIFYHFLINLTEFNHIMSKKKRFLMKYNWISINVWCFLIHFFFDPLSIYEKMQHFTTKCYIIRKSMDKAIP